MAHVCARWLQHPGRRVPQCGFHHRELGDHSYFAYFIVEDVDAEFARVQATGAEIIKRVRSEPWHMREFGLRTVDGHRIMIAERLGAS